MATCGNGSKIVSITVMLVHRQPEVLGPQPATPTREYGGAALGIIFQATCGRSTVAVNPRATVRSTWVSVLPEIYKS